MLEYKKNYQHTYFLHKFASRAMLIVVGNMLHYLSVPFLAQVNTKGLCLHVHLLEKQSQQVSSCFDRSDHTKNPTVKNTIDAIVNIITEEATAIFLVDLMAPVIFFL